MKKRTYAKKLGFTALFLILVLVMLYSGFRIVESTILRSAQTAGKAYVSKTITHNGVDYFPRQDITTILVLGIDQHGPVADSGSYQNRGAADMVALLVLDQEKREYHILQLNRDTMVEMPVLGLNGRQAGTTVAQLALSHTYGSGLADSCENTKTTVSNFLHGVPIDYYVSLNMDAISIVNDGVGGVTVEVTDDFSMIDPTIPKGQVTLMGQQAVSFVRSRQGLGDQLNLSRMERQQAYMDGFVEAFREKQGDELFLAELYEDVTPYMVTDCSLNTITGLLSRCGDYHVGEILVPPGENVMGETYFEFYVDEDQLTEMVLELFYAPKGSS